MQPALAARRAVRAPAPWPRLLLFGRLFLFAAFQAVFALGYYLAGVPAAWQASIAWWPLTVTFTNIAMLALLVRLYGAEGRHYWDVFRVQREHVRRDLLAMAGLLVITGPVAYLPNVLLANALFGSPQAAVDVMLRPLPLWAAYASLLLFPLAQGLVELPVYFLYAMPRLAANGLSRWLALALAAGMLSLQHIAIPLVFDVRFIAWRGLMFMPFALLAGLALYWRPRLVPYMAVVRILMDFSFALMLLGA